MPVTVERDEFKWIMSAEGHLTVTSAAELKACLLAWLASGKDLQMDFDRVEEIDIAAMQLIWAAAREAESKRLKIVSRMSDAVMAAMRDSGFGALSEFPSRG